MDCPSAHPPCGSIPLCRCDAIVQKRRGIEEGIPHSEGPEDMFVTVLIQGLSGNSLDDLPQYLKIDIAVNKQCPWRSDRFFFGDLFKPLCVPRPVRREIQSRLKTRIMGEQVTDPNVFLSVCFELREVVGDGVFETHLPNFDELHQCGCGRNHLGEGGDVKDGVQGHRLPFRLYGPEAKGETIENFLPVSNQEDAPWKLTHSNRLSRALFDGSYLLFGEGLQRVGRGGEKRLDEKREKQEE